MNGYELSRGFCDWAFENPHKIKPIHYAIYFFSIEHCNRLGWKRSFGLPSQMVMEAIGVKNWRTYSAGLNDLVDFGFVEMLERSKNQYSSNIIAIVNFTKAPTKALDKALQKHSTKHSTKQGQSIVSIDKQETIKQETINNITIFSPIVEEVFIFSLDFFPENLHPKTPKQINDWKKTIKQLHEIDGHDYDTIRYLIQKTREDEFWSKNFLSVIKLRKNDNNGVKYFNVFFEKFKIINNGKFYDPLELQRQFPDC